MKYWYKGKRICNSCFVTSGVDCAGHCRENNQYKCNDQYKIRTSCDVTIAEVHIAILMLKRYMVQPYKTFQTLSKADYVQMHHAHSKWGGTLSQVDF